MKKIEIIVGDERDELTLKAELGDSKIAEKLLEKLPLSAPVNFWGEEIYSKVPLDQENEEPRTRMEVGDLAYWPEGNSFCLFYGSTPSSSDDEPVAASPVTKIGKVISGISELKNLNEEKIKKINLKKEGQ